MSMRHFSAILSLGLACAHFVHAAPDERPPAEIEALRTLDYRFDGGGLHNQLAAAIVESDDSAAWESKLLAVALDPDAMLEGRRLACQLLRLCAGEASVSALAPLLEDPQLSHSARLILESIDSSEASQVLVEALQSTSGSLRLGIIGSLAVRADSVAVKPLQAVVENASDAATTEAALRALGAIGSPEAAEFFLRTFPPEGTGTRAIRRAYSMATADLLDEGLNHLTREQVWILVERLRGPDTPVELQAAAIGAAMRLNPRHIQPLVATIGSDDPALQRAGATFIPSIVPQAETVNQLIEAAAEFDLLGQTLVLEGLTAKSRPEILPFARARIGSDDDDLRVAAIRSVGILGDASDLPILLPLIEGRSTVNDAARNALTRLPDPAADERLVQEFRRSDAVGRVELVQVIAQRGLRDAVPALLNEAESTEAFRLTAAIYGAIGDLATPAELPELLNRLSLAERNLQGPISRAVVTIGRRYETGEVTQRLVDRYQKAEGSDRSTLVRMIGAIGDEIALDFIVPLADRDDPDTDAVRSLSAWRDLSAFPAMKSLVNRPGYPDDARLTLWRGMLRLSSDALDNWHNGAMSFWTDTFQSAPGTAQERQQLSAAETFVREPILAWFEEHFDHPELGESFQAAHESMQQAMLRF